MGFWEHPVGRKFKECCAPFTDEPVGFCLIVTGVILVLTPTLILGNLCCMPFCFWCMPT